MDLKESRVVNSIFYILYILDAHKCENICVHALLYFFLFLPVIYILCRGEGKGGVGSARPSVVFMLNYA